MFARLSCAVLVALVACGGSARADIYAAGPVYGGNAAGGTITCRVLNAGVGTVNISLKQIITNTNAILVPTIDSCNVPLPSANYCDFRFSPGSNFAYTCRLVVSGTDPNLSGSIDVQTSGSAVLVNAPLQRQ